MPRICNSGTTIGYLQNHIEWRQHLELWETSGSEVRLSFVVFHSLSDSWERP